MHISDQSCQGKEVHLLQAGNDSKRTVQQTSTPRRCPWTTQSCTSHENTPWAPFLSIIVLVMFVKTQALEVLSSTRMLD